LIAPQDVRDEAPTLDEVLRDRDVIGGVFGNREHDQGRRQRPDHE
jgi:hypothetical protein